MPCIQVGRLPPPRVFPHRASTAGSSFYGPRSNQVITQYQTADPIVPLPISTFRRPRGTPLAGENGIVMGFAVRRPEGIVLVDTGIGFGNAEVDRQYHVSVQPLDRLLSGHGIAAEDVIAVVNSHLHFDHAGQNALFPRRPIFVQEAEWMAAHQPDYTLLEWIEFPGASYVRVDGEHEVVPGVRLLPTPGHTPGHQSVLIDGETLLAGQAVYTRAEWERHRTRLEGESNADDRSLYRESLARLRALAPRTVWFGHDASAWKR